MYALKTLEYVAILDEVSKYAFSNKAKELILSEKPRSVFSTVKRLLDETDLARSYYASFLDLPLEGFNITESLISRIKLKAILNINDLNLIAGSIYAANNVIFYYRNNIVKNKLEGALDEYFLALSPLKKLNAILNDALDDNGGIKDSATGILFNIREKAKSYEVELRAKMQNLLQEKAKMLTESLIAMRDGKMCLPVKIEYKNQIKGIIHDESASHSTVYIEPFVAIEISNRLIGVKEEEKAEIARILMLLSNEVSNYRDEIIANYERLVGLDVIYAKAKYAYQNDCYKPMLNDLGITKLVKARHPLIAKEKCVPIDLLIGDGYDAIIITGPNTGGKTVALKTTGLLSLMAQTGLLIPASSESNLNVYENIFADIGDEQSIIASLSSFSAHMTNVIKILDNLSYNSLVLLDELGSGTDPKEGSNLAISIVEEILKYGSKAIVTTHYENLKAFAYQHERIINASVEFNTETLAPTYKLMIGVPGKSNALIIAKKLGLNETIIERAKQLNELEHTDISLMLKRLDENNILLNNKLNDVEILKKELNEKLLLIKQKENKLALEYTKYQHEAREKALQIVDNTTQKATELLAKLKEMQKKNYKEHELANIKHELNNLIENESIDAPSFDFKVGDTVFVPSWNQNGVIKKINKDKFEVSIANFNVVFKKSELTLKRNGLTKEIKPPKKESTTLKASTAKLECDLRGLRYDEVYNELDCFIDRAYLAGLRQVYIIHGFGTGAVRKATYEFLKKCPYVKSSRFGGEGEGLNGVTVVYLK